MHELKFRAWDIQDGMMVYFKKGFLDNSPCYRDNIMQYTGAKDMNGTEIYEEDVIRKEMCAPDDPAFGAYGSIGVVKYNSDVMGFIIDTAHTGDDGFYDNMGTNFSFDEIEIIGNIYENPEMI